MSKILKELNSVQAETKQSSLRKLFPLNDRAAVVARAEKIKNQWRNYLFLIKKRPLTLVLSFILVLTASFAYKFRPHGPHINPALKLAKVPNKATKAVEKSTPITKDLELKHEFAMIQFNDGRYPDAIVSWKKLLTQYPNESALVGYLARAYRLNQQNKEAYDLLLSAERRYPKDVSIQNSLAILEIEKSSSKKAITRLVELEKNNGSNSDIIFNLAAAYEVDHQWAYALDAYNKFLQLAPNDTMASAIRVRLNKLRSLGAVRDPAGGAE